MFYFLSWYCQLWLSCCFLLVNSSFKFSPFGVVFLGKKNRSSFFLGMVFYVFVSGFSEFLFLRKLQEICFKVRIW